MSSSGNPKSDPGPRRGHLEHPRPGHDPHGRHAQLGPLQERQRAGLFRPQVRGPVSATGMDEVLQVEGQAHQAASVPEPGRRDCGPLVSRPHPGRRDHHRLPPELLPSKDGRPGSHRDRGPGPLRRLLQGNHPVRPTAGPPLQFVLTPDPAQAHHLQLPGRPDHRTAS
jgi:hypothetical protein